MTPARKTNTPEMSRELMDDVRQWLIPVLLSAILTLISVIGSQMLGQQRDSKAVLDTLVGTQGLVNMRLNNIETRQVSIMADVDRIKAFRVRMEALNDKLEEKAHNDN